MSKTSEFRIFLSYARANTINNKGAIPKLKRLIEEQVNEVTGEAVKIFKDDESLDPGAPINEIKRTIDEDAILMIALITPSFFKSDNCREEIRNFLDTEKRLGRNDLIIPIYLIDVDEIENELKHQSDITETDDEAIRLARTLLQRNLLDFREFYKENFNKRRCKKAIGEIASKIKKVFRIFEEIKTEKDVPQEGKTKSSKSSKSSETEYGKRIYHFAPEKDFLADRFGEYLWARLNHLKQPVILLIDSGTTLFNFFKKFGGLAIEATRKGNRWIKNLMVITNNLAGIDWLLEHGKESDTRWAEIALSCMMLSGTPLSTYNAATSLSKENVFYEVLKSMQPHIMLENMIKSGNYKVIALVTGNWIRIRNSFPHYPIPMVRGRGHLEIKQAMINLADEVYVVATLGKIFAGISHSTVEANLHDFVTSQKDGGDLYQEVVFNAQPIREVADDEYKILNKIRLVTTSRSERYLLSNLSKLLEKEDVLDASKITAENFEIFKRPFYLSGFNAVSNLMFNFDPDVKDIKSEVQTEFPHKESWTEDFLKSFHVSDENIKKFFGT